MQEALEYTLPCANCLWCISIIQRPGWYLKYNCNSTSWQWKDSCLESEAFVLLHHQHFNLIFNASRISAGPAFYLSTPSARRAQELLFMWERVCVCVCVGGGGVNAIDGNGLVVINISLEITGPFLYWITNHFAFIMIGIFTAQWLVFVSFYSFCDLFLVFTGGQRKYLTVDIKESNCTPPALSMAKLSQRDL